MIDQTINGFSIIISFHKQFRGFSKTNPFKGQFNLILGWIRIEKRPHIEILDRRVKRIVNSSYQSSYDALSYYFTGDETYLNLTNND